MAEGEEEGSGEFCSIGTDSGGGVPAESTPELTPSPDKNPKGTAAW